MSNWFGVELQLHYELGRAYKMQSPPDRLKDWNRGDSAEGEGLLERRKEQGAADCPAKERVTLWFQLSRTGLDWREIALKFRMAGNTTVDNKSMPMGN